MTELAAGRELDALIGKHIMGETQKTGIWAGEVSTRVATVDVVNGVVTLGRFEWPPYSTDIAAAWTVVEKLGPVIRNFGFMVSWNNFGYSPKWEAGWYEWSCEGPEGRFTAESQSVPYAICLAALKIVDVINEKGLKR